MYTTGEGFNLSKPVNKLDQKQQKQDKENDVVVSMPEDKQKKEEPTKQGQDETQKNQMPFGPQKNMDQSQPMKNNSKDENEFNEMDQDGSAVKSTESSDEEILDANDPEYHAKNIQRMFKQRCKKAMREQMKELVLPDQDGYKDPQVLSEFANDIYK